MSQRQPILLSGVPGSPCNAQDAGGLALPPPPLSLPGRRPWQGASGFAIFGQLTQLTHFGPAPTRIAFERAPRVHAWADLPVEDRKRVDAPLAETGCSALIHASA